MGSPLFFCGYERSKGNSFACAQCMKKNTWKNNQSDKVPLLISAHSLWDQDLEGQLGLKCLVPTFTLGNVSRVSSSKRGLPQGKYKNVNAQGLGWYFTHITAPYPFTKCPCSQTSEKLLGNVPPPSQDPS